METVQRQLLAEAQLSPCSSAGMQGLALAAAEPGSKVLDTGTEVLRDGPDLGRLLLRRGRRIGAAGGDQDLQQDAPRDEIGSEELCRRQTISTHRMGLWDVLHVPQRLEPGSAAEV